MSAKDPVHECREPMVRRDAAALRPLLAAHPARVLVSHR
jgi:hypothetical protein